MKVLPPVVVTDGMVITSSVYETAPAAYASGTTYALAAYVSVPDVLGKILIYKSLQAGNLNKTPASNPLWWEYGSLTYEIFNTASWYTKGYRVIDLVTHNIYQSVISDNYGRPFDMVATPPWLALGKSTLALPGAYNAGTTYGAGDTSTVTTTSGSYNGSPIVISRMVYKSLAAANLNNNPSVSPSWWEAVTSYPVPYELTMNFDIGRVVKDVDGYTFQSLLAANKGIPINAAASWVKVGTSNKFAAFDTQSSTQAIANKSLSFTIATGTIEAMALINCAGDFATITVRDGLGGAIVYSNTSGIAGDVVADWYDYLFSDPTIQRTQVLFTGIPPYLTSHVTITITSTGAVAAGDLIFGRWKDVGLTNYGLQAGITDFSLVTTDDFGTTNFVKRGNKKYMDCRQWIPNADFNRAFNLLSRLPATPCLWLAGDVADYSEALMLKAYYKDFSVDIAGPQEAYCTLKLIGLI